MATINVRVSDEVRDRLELSALRERQSLSEYVRDVLSASAFYQNDDDVTSSGDLPAPESMADRDRHVLALLHEILEHVDEREADYHQGRVEVLQKGFTAEYEADLRGYSVELSRSDCRLVRDILDMFRVVGASVARLSEDGTPVSADTERRLSYQGFDFNDRREGHMASYVDHLVRTERWQEVRPIIEGDSRGNSHGEMLPTYSRMLARYKEAITARRREVGFAAYELATDDLSAIEVAGYGRPAD
ncbi:YfbU family protein [Schumannella soli]|uniref:YfbU family protein n=1 Tax=Schumannella soli TaxID=2590779 RepID=A0A506Y9A1_9MICO|nr:YfbU family protein [Schumannella soli]TPW78070.1 YfbU family protein [Schumannella soli]